MIPTERPHPNSLVLITKGEVDFNFVLKKLRVKLKQLDFTRMKMCPLLTFLALASACLPIETTYVKYLISLAQKTFSST